MTSPTDGRSTAALQLKPGEARPVEPGMSRRSFLRNVSVAAVAGAIPAAAVATVSALSGLIAAHTEAQAAYTAAAEARESVEDSIHYTSFYVPMMFTPDGKAHTGHLELRPGGEEHVRHQLIEHHERLRRSICSPVAMALSPEHCAVAERGIDASLAACLKALGAGIEELRRQEDAAGLTAVQQRLDDAFAEVDRLCVAILGHVPASPSEAQMKAEWIATEQDRRGSYFSSEEMDALVASIAGKAVA